MDMSEPSIPFSKAAAEAFDRAYLSATIERLRSQPNDDRARMALFVLGRRPKSLAVPFQISSAGFAVLYSRD
jgi:hypothetical protein